MKMEDSQVLQLKLCVCLVTQSCLTLCDLTDCSPPDSSVHGDSPGKNTRVAMPSSRGSSQPKNSILQCDIADNVQVCARFEVVVFLIFISFSGPLNLALGGFLAAPPLISNSWNPPFGIQGRSWRLESCLQETRDKRKGFYAQEPTWCSPTPTVSPRFLTHGNYEIINGCCFSS